MKHIRLFAAVLLCILLCTGCAESTLSDPSDPVSEESSTVSGLDDMVYYPSFGGFAPVETFGTKSAFFAENVYAHALLKDGVEADGGYYVIDRKTRTKLAFFDKDGSLVWEKLIEAASDENSLLNLKIVAAGNGCVLLYKDYNAHKTFLVRYDKNGNVLWKTAPDFLADSLAYLAENFVYILPGGETVLLGIGYESDNLPANPNIVSPGKLVLCRFSQNGELTETVFFGTTGVKLFDAAYIPGAGFAMLVQFPGNGYASEYLLFDESFSLVWNIGFAGTYLFDIEVCGNTLISGGPETVFCHSLTDGSAVWEQNIKNANFGYELQLAGDAVYVQDIQDNMLYGIDAKTGKKVFSAAFDAGTLKRVIPLEDGTLLTVSEHMTRMLPTPIWSSYMRFATELVYMGFSQDGTALFCDGYDYVTE